MNKEQLQTLIMWLKEQIEFVNLVISECRQVNNYGKEIEYEGMRDAYLRCLDKLQTE